MQTDEFTLFSSPDMFDLWRRPAAAAAAAGAAAAAAAVAAVTAVTAAHRSLQLQCNGQRTAQRIGQPHGAAQRARGTGHRTAVTGQLPPGTGHRERTGHGPGPRRVRVSVRVLQFTVTVYSCSP